MLESLKNTAAIWPEIIALCLSPQEGPEKVAATPKIMMASPFVETISTPNDKARLPILFYTSPMNDTQLMFETALTKECVTTASLQTLRGIVTTALPGNGD